MAAPSRKTTAELFAAARRLEAEAIALGEDGLRGHELRAQAAELRVQALGEKPYPIVVCVSCRRVTGWTDAAGSCEPCLAHTLLRDAYRDPHAGWVDVSDRRARPAPARAPLGARLAALARRRGGSERAAALAWLSRVEPGETGPVSPEPGYELEVARRAEAQAPDGSGILIRFSTRACRFDGGRWLDLERTKVARADILVPAEFSAGLPIEQLAEAWGDYQAAVEALNRRAWERESLARDARRQARAAAEDALRQQRHVSELLDEGR